MVRLKILHKENCRLSTSLALYSWSALPFHLFVKAAMAKLINQYILNNKQFLLKMKLQDKDNRYVNTIHNNVVRYFFAFVNCSEKIR